MIIKENLSFSELISEITKKLADMSGVDVCEVYNQISENDFALYEGDGLFYISTDGDKEY